MNQATFYIVCISLCLNIACNNITPSITGGQNVIERKSASNIFIVAGDFQKTSFLEKLIGRESNDTEREFIVSEIANSDPAFLVVLGDLVYDGSIESDWEEFDKLIKPVTSKNIPLYTVPGNHDYWGSNSSALKNYSLRFGNNHWYRIKFDSLALIILDSNIDDLAEQDWKTQLDWFKNILNESDNDSSIIGTFVFLHHPPYTNSAVTSDERHVLEAFVPLFNNSTKSLAMITGHAHTYERFIKQNKTFIVSGGGGGPRVNLKPAVERYHEDLLRNYPDSSSKRPFNFLIVEREGNDVNVLVRGLLKNEINFFELERFKLPLDTQPL